MRRAEAVLGVFTICLPPEAAPLTAGQRELIASFAAQIALLVEREQLHAAAEREKLLAESDRLHRTLLDSVSHELKTPLAVLRAAAENLGKAPAGPASALADEILTATHRLDWLVANLLSQTRLESGSLTPQMDWCDARDLFGAARRSVGPVLGDRVVKTVIADDMPLFMADAPLMENILANLLLNVALHTPPGGQLVLAAGVEAGGGRIFVSVADQGPGIPPELRPTLFQKFRRGRTARAGGLGLGLSIVRGFTLAQGGEVRAEDNPGGGARFTIFLPASLQETVPQE
jgi:two-component system sensor histidine kinase KdpD